MIQAEVMNLSRDVHMTTPNVYKYVTKLFSQIFYWILCSETSPPAQNANMNWKNYDGKMEDLYGFQGITTRQAFGGTMVMEYTRIDNCGRPYLGYYCEHFLFPSKTFVFEAYIFIMSEFAPIVPSKEMPSQTATTKR